MSKINSKKSLIDVLNSNKIKLTAGLLTFTMIGTFSGCNLNDKEQAVTTTTEQNHLEQLKNRIESNIDNIYTVKDDEYEQYIISEYIYREEPMYETNTNGEKYIKYYESKCTSILTYNISYENAEYLGLTEILDEKLTGTRVK